LGVIAALGKSNHLTLTSVLVPIVAIAVILALAFTVGQRAVDALFRQVRRREGSGVDAMTITLFVTFLLAVLAQVAKSDAVLGAYIAGILIGRSRFFQKRIATQLESLTMAVFAPVFFATAGLRIDLAGLASGTALMWAGIVLAIAIVTKVAGAFGGAKLARLSNREGLALAIGLNCRGAVEVVIATVGLTIGVLSGTAYTAIVLMAILTSVMAPPLLRLVVRDWPGDAEEQERLEHEEAMERNLLVRATRLLLPTRGRASSEVVAHVMNAVWPKDVAVTVMAVEREDGGGMPDVQPLVAAFGEREVEVVEADGDPLESVLEEAKLGYGAIGLGAVDTFHEGGTILTPVVDDLLGRSPLPMVIVRRGKDHDNLSCQFRRALVPVAGSPASRTAQELAYNLARSLGTDVRLTHVVTRPAEPYPAGDFDMRAHARVAATTEVASGVIEQARTLAQEHSVEPSYGVREGEGAADELLTEAAESNCDLIVLGTTIRRLHGRAFLGHTVEHVLDHAEATVVVVAIPDTLLAGGIAERDAGADTE
jgi:nucleotide-binding universal stress UspA family protein